MAPTATLDDQPRVPVAAVLVVPAAAAHALVVVARAPAVVAHVPVAADAPVVMAGSVVAGDAVDHRSQRRALSAKRYAQRGQ